MLIISVFVIADMIKIDKKIIGNNDEYVAKGLVINIFATAILTILIIYLKYK